MIEQKDEVQKKVLKSTIKRKPPPKKNQQGQQRKRRKPKKSKGFIIASQLSSFLFYVVTLGFLFLMILFGISQSQDKALNGYRFFGVLSDSMVSPDNTLKKGGFRSGDIIVIKETPDDQIKVGDIITYHPSANPTNKSTNNLTHRVVKIEQELGGEKGTFFVTRGDANKTDDMPINATQVVGKVRFRIPKIGGVLAFVKDIFTFMKRNPILSGIFIFAVLGFFLVVRIYILGDKKQPVRQRKKKRQKHPTHDIASTHEVNINRKTHNRRKQR